MIQWLKNAYNWFTSVSKLLLFVSGLLLGALICYAYIFHFEARYPALVCLAFGGALGGVVICVLTGEIDWEYDKNKEPIQLGIVVSGFIGAVAAFVMWSVYGPIAGELVLTSGKPVDLTWLQFGTSILTGMGGSKLLIRMAQQHAIDVENKALKGEIKKLKDFMDAELPASDGEENVDGGQPEEPGESSNEETKSNK